jgi:hypothetical protein
LAQVFDKLLLAVGYWVALALPVTHLVQFFALPATRQGKNHLRPAEQDGLAAS